MLVIPIRDLGHHDWWFCAHHELSITGCGAPVTLMSYLGKRQINRSVRWKLVSDA